MENRILRRLLRRLFGLCLGLLVPSKALALGDFGGSSLDPSDMGLGVGAALPPRLYVNTPDEYQRIMGLKGNGDAFYRNIQVMRGFNPRTGAPLSSIMPMRLNQFTRSYVPDFYSSLALGGGTFIFDNAAQANAITQYFALIQGAGILSRGVGMASGSGAYLPMEGLVLGQVPKIFTTVAPMVSTPARITTVLGSRVDVAPYVGREGFNVLDMTGIPEAEWARTNAQFLNSALVRGDNVWLLTNPLKHQNLMTILNKRSFYLDLELPMLNEYGASTSPLLKYLYPTIP